MIGNNTSDTIPDAYLCPLTLDLLSDPVTTGRGFTFERHAIVTWLSKDGERTCPLSREPLEEWELVDNTDLKKEIAKWKKDQGVADEKAPKSPTPTKVNRAQQMSKNKVVVSPHLIKVRERVLKRREQQFRAQLGAIRS